MTSSRLRVLSRRADTAAEPVPEPARAAREAIRQFHAADPTRSFLERYEWLRLAARRMEARRRQASAGREAQRKKSSEGQVKQP
jgi:hypothetical protein